MNLGNLKPAVGSTRKTKRIGRGVGSGHGKTSTRGHKGQHARSGAKFRAWFEGGQMPLQRRIPKTGFKNIFREEYQVVNVGALERLSQNKVLPEDLLAARLIRKKNVPLKILGEGKLSKAVEVSAHAFSKSAVQKIEAAGGKAIRL
ncbi:MAG TPA: 50S ribosomal protein L15 [bacterium]